MSERTKLSRFKAMGDRLVVKNIKLCTDIDLVNYGAFWDKSLTVAIRAVRFLHRQLLCTNTEKLTFWTSKVIT